MTEKPPQKETYSIYSVPADRPFTIRGREGMFIKREKNRNAIYTFELSGHFKSFKRSDGKREAAFPDANIGDTSVAVDEQEELELVTREELERAFLKALENRNQADDSVSD